MAKAEVKEALISIGVVLVVIAIIAWPYRGTIEAWFWSNIVIMTWNAMIAWIFALPGNLWNLIVGIF